VVAFSTEIAEPDRDGGALRYRGVNVENLVAARVEFGDVWALLVDGKFGDSLPPAEPFEVPVHTRDVRVDVQAGLAMLAPTRRYRPLLDIDDQTAREQLARTSAMALPYVTQSARGLDIPAVPQSTIDECTTAAGQFMIRWKGDPDPRHIEAIDAYWVSAAEHGMKRVDLHLATDLLLFEYYEYAGYADDAPRVQVSSGSASRRSLSLTTHSAEPPVRPPDRAGSARHHRAQR
jgi:citrate synthase